MLYSSNITHLQLEILIWLSYGKTGVESNRKDPNFIPVKSK